MIERGFLQVRRPLFMTRRERALAGKLADTRDTVLRVKRKDIQKVGFHATWRCMVRSSPTTAVGG